MPLVVNCDCDCPYPVKTLAELRQSVLDGLGFIDPLTFASPRTLGVLRADVISRLGFIDQIGIETQSLATLRETIKARLGLAETVNTNTRTIAQLLLDILPMIGSGATASNPAPGTRAMVIAFINEAQQTTWRRLELDKGSAGDNPSPPAAISLDSDTTTVDGQLVLTLATALTKAHYEQPDSKAYFDQYERALSDQIARMPPNIDAMIRQGLQEAQRTIYRRYELGKSGTITLAAFSEDTDVTTVDSHLVLLLAMANLKAKLKQPDAEAVMNEFEHLFADMLRRAPPNLVTLVNSALKSAYRSVLRRFEIGKSGALTQATFATDGDTPNCDDQPIFLLACGQLAADFKRDDAKALLAEYETYMADLLKRSLPNATKVVTRALKMAQEQLYYRYRLFRQERFFTWTLEANERFYGIGENDEQTGGSACTKALDPRALTWIGVCDSQDNCWRPLKNGIPPELYVSAQTGIPTHYEMRQCVEVWPSPIAGWKLRIKGDFGLLPFESDDDDSTLDWQAIELQALADCKAHYKQPDAMMAKQAAETYLRSLVARSHMTGRYIPGEREPVNAVRPLMKQEIV